MHGQSKQYTPIKQDHLRGIMEIGKNGWNPLNKPWVHKEAIVVDCTSGNGESDTGEDGSPVIINRYFRNAGYPFRQLCCEQTPMSFMRLQQTGITADFRLGKYQDLVIEWLDGLHVQFKKPAMGFLYCDPNGVKDLLEGRPLFEKLSKDPRYRCLDFVFHWSLTAYKRNEGAKTEWASGTSLSRIISELCSFKKRAIIREPIDKHRWVIMYLLNTESIDGRWGKAGFLPADKWMDEYLLEKKRPSLFDNDYNMTGVSA